MKQILIKILLIQLISISTLHAQDLNAFKMTHSQYEFNSIGMDGLWHWRANRFPVAHVQNPHQWGYMDTSGKIVIPLQYEYAGKFSNGVALVRFKGKYGYINMNGKVVIPFQYDDAGHFIDGKASVANYYTEAVLPKLRWKTIDLKGQEVK